jgi:hypothetical protein
MLMALKHCQPIFIDWWQTILDCNKQAVQKGRVSPGSETIIPRSRILFLPPFIQDWASKHTSSAALK